jgi:hypothetical protein
VIAVLCAPFLALVLYFSTKSVFFERNFAHAMPLLLLAAGAGLAAVVRRLQHRMARGLAVCAAAVPGLYWSVQIAHAARWAPEEALAFEQQHDLVMYDRISGGLNLNFRAPPPVCGRIVLLTFSDAWTARYENNVRSAGYREVARRLGPFSHLAPSTLQIYVAHDRKYFAKPCAEALRPLAAEVAESWRIDGYHEQVGAPPVAGKIWASHYPAGDAGVGVSRVRFAVPRDTPALTLQAVTGPDATGQRLRVLGPDDALIAEIPIASGFQSWRTVRIAAPEGGFPAEIVIEGVDDGGAWGQWMAFGAPRAPIAGAPPGEG